MARKKVNISFKISGKSAKYNIIPPWCSSGKVSEKRKLAPKEIQSSYPLRENIYEYLHDNTNLKSCCKNKNSKRDEVESCARRTKILLVLLIAGVIATLWIYPIPYLELSTKIIEKTKIVLFERKIPSASEQCCHEMRHLALELSRAEQILRMTLASRVKLEKPTASYHYIPGVTVTKGSSTEEWSGRVNLWGLIPLWRTPSPPDTVLALRRPTPADCWPFSGSSGGLHFKLPTIQRVESISIDHVRPDTARSAPKQFIAYGVLTNGTSIEILNNEYRRHGPAKQYYHIDNNLPITGVIFNVLTNHGNSKYTCIYRIHLHGN